MYTSLIRTLVVVNDHAVGDDDCAFEEEDWDGTGNGAGGGTQGTREALAFKKICCISRHRRQPLLALRLALIPKLVKGFVKTAAGKTPPVVDASLLSPSSTIPSPVQEGMPQPNSTPQNGGEKAEVEVEGLDGHRDKSEQNKKGYDEHHRNDDTDSSPTGADNMRSPELPRGFTDLNSPFGEFISARGTHGLASPLLPTLSSVGSTPAAPHHPSSPTPLRHRQPYEAIYDFDNSYHQAPSQARGLPRPSLSPTCRDEQGSSDHEAAQDQPIWKGVLQTQDTSKQLSVDGRLSFPGLVTLAKVDLDLNKNVKITSPDASANHGIAVDTDVPPKHAKWAVSDATLLRVLSSRSDETAWLDDIVINNIVQLAMLSCAYYPLPSGCLPLRDKTSSTVSGCSDIMFKQDLKDLFQYRGVGFAYNEGSTHWSLVYLDFKQRVIATADPRSNSSSNSISADDPLTQLVQHLRPGEDLTVWRRRSIACPQQTDTHNCGIYTIHSALSIAAALGSWQETEGTSSVALEDVTIPTDVTLDTSIWRQIIASFHRSTDQQNLRASIPDSMFQQPSLVVTRDQDQDQQKQQQQAAGESNDTRATKKSRTMHPGLLDMGDVDPATAINTLLARVGQVRLATLPRIKEKIAAIDNLLLSLKSAQELFDSLAAINVGTTALLLDQVHKITGEEERRAGLVQDLRSLRISGGFPGQEEALDAAMREGGKALAAARRCYQAQLDHLHEGSRRAGDLGISDLIGELEGVREACRATQQSVRESVRKGVEYLQQLDVDM